MIFSIYALRDRDGLDFYTPALFDRDVGSPDMREETWKYDCVGVYEVDDPMESVRIDWDTNDYPVLTSTTDEWCLTVNQIVAGEYYDYDSSLMVPITCLWRAE